VDTIASLGITRILTSGHARTALDGAAEIDALTRHDPQAKVTILPGSGVNAATLAELKLRAPLLTEAHFSASASVPGEGEGTDPLTRGEEFGFGTAQVWTLEADKVRMVRELVDSWERE
jgi:copper homeostasis protein